jgi:hypothetical protein
VGFSEIRLAFIFCEYNCTLNYDQKKVSKELPFQLQQKGKVYFTSIDFPPIPLTQAKLKKVLPKNEVGQSRSLMYPKKTPIVPLATCTVTQGSVLVMTMFWLETI